MYLFPERVLVRTRPPLATHLVNAAGIVQYFGYLGDLRFFGFLLTSTSRHLEVLSDWIGVSWGRLAIVTSLAVCRGSAASSGSFPFTGLQWS